MRLISLTLNVLFFTGLANAEPAVFVPDALPLATASSTLTTAEIQQLAPREQTSVTRQEPAKLAIIIDDIGNNLKAGLDALSLPGELTFAVLPHRRHSHELAVRASRLGKEVILHAPMSTLDGRFIGAGALSDDLNEKQFKDRLRHAIDSLPYIRGMNNHMGSRLTQNSQAMAWVMDVLKEQELFFVDSRTTAETVAFSTAQQSGIGSATRDVFLDHDINTDAIHQQFKRAIAVAQKYGSAIAIGHPHPETLNYLAQMLPELKAMNIELVSAGNLIAYGIQTRPLPSGYAAPAQAPNLDMLIKNIALKN